MKLIRRVRRFLAVGLAVCSLVCGVIPTFGTQVFASTERITDGVYTIKNQSTHKYLTTRAGMLDDNVYQSYTYTDYWAIEYYEIDDTYRIQNYYDKQAHYYVDLEEDAHGKIHFQNGQNIVLSADDTWSHEWQIEKWNGMIRFNCYLDPTYCMAVIDNLNGSEDNRGPLSAGNVTIQRGTTTNTKEWWVLEYKGAIGKV